MSRLGVSKEVPPKSTSVPRGSFSCTSAATRSSECVKPPSLEAPKPFRSFH